MRTRRRTAFLLLTVSITAAVSLGLCGIASAQSDLQTLHTFVTAEGEFPDGSLIQGTDGNFYGTTSFTGMVDQAGSVFRMTATGQVMVLHTFHGSAFDLTDGGNPLAALIQATDGNFYGTTSQGGAFNHGTIFKITPAGVLTILHSFAGDPTDGAYPTSALLQAADGNFYGTTAQGGGTFGSGTIFKMTPDGTVTVLHAFAGIPNDGISPYGPLVQAPDGSFLGTTIEGGRYNEGTVFKLTPTGFYSLLHEFQGRVANDGATPKGGLLRGSDGFFYGTTSEGGSADFSVPDAGVIFRITDVGGYQILHVFAGSPVDGENPENTLIQATDGYFYGTTTSGGLVNDGTLFRMSSDGNVTILHSFDINTTGFRPVAGLIQAADGNFYGVTEWGGSASGGTAFRLMRSSKALMALPKPGSTLAASTVTFNWNAGPGASAYRLEVGSAVGGNDVFGQNLGLATSQSVSGLPAFGETVYVRLWTEINGDWRYNDYVYTAYNAKAVMTSPTPGSAFAGSGVNFVWNGGTGVSEYWLEIGTSLGQGNLFEQSVGLATNQTVNGLPLVGGWVYVRLWTRVGSRWSFNDYTYGAANTAKAVMIAPVPFSTFIGSSATFTWIPGSGASQYWLEVGTSVGLGNLFTQSTGVSTSQTVSGLPMIGATVFVRLWTLSSGNWLYNDYSYTSFNAKAAMVSPTPGLALSGSSVTFSWSASPSASQYWLDVGTAAGKSDLFGQSVGLATSQTINNLPIAGVQIFVRLWSQINGNWAFNDYGYVSFDARAALSSPVPGFTLTGSTVTFSWTPGIGALEYWLEVGTSPNQHDLFGRSVGLATSQTVSGLPVTGGLVAVTIWTRVGTSWLSRAVTYTAFDARAALTAPWASPLAGTSVTFTWTTGTGATAYWLDVGTSPAGSNLFSQSAGLSTGLTVTGLPASGDQIFVRLWTQINGVWYSNSYVFRTFNARAVLTVPPPGPALTQSTVQFGWNGVPGASQYWLEVGTSMGLADIFTASTGTSTSQIVSGIPTVADAIHVRLWTLFNGVWLYNDSMYGGHVITFVGVAGNGSPFTTYTESGFSVNATSGPWVVYPTFGNPAPFILFQSSSPQVTGEVTVSPSAGSFHFNSIDLFVSTGTVSYEITGTGSSGTVFTLTRTVGNSGNSFVTVTNPQPAEWIDQLHIKLSPACCNSAIGIDNIKLSR